MRRIWGCILLAAIGYGSLGCERHVSPAQPPALEKTSQEVRPTESPAPQPAGAKIFQRVRQAAVAGLFYPRHKDDLAKTVDDLLREAKLVPVKNLRALVCPHAGYEYSGPVAAVGYKLVAGRDFRTVIVMAPSHYARFTGAAIPEVDACETPLGMIPLSPKATQLAQQAPFVGKANAEVHRPDWWQQSPIELPAFGEETPHTWEHSMEVQLPFLQRVLKDFTLIPIVFGEVDAQQAARVLAKYIDDKTLVIASSDLSHYYPYQVAVQKDSSCVRAICELDAKWIDNEEACGKLPILTLIHVARAKGWKAKLLDLRNSGDTAGDKSHVVGYAAIAFYAPSEAQAASEPAAKTELAAKAAAQYTPAERKLLLELARKTVTAAARGEKLPSLEGEKFSEKLRQHRACFVTLTKNGQLRGCIGSIFPQEPLCEAVVSRARSAAMEDPRFSPVEAGELDQIEIEISVLTVPQRLDFSSPEDLLKKLRPRVDGVVLRVGSREATFLPQVWEQLPDKEEFLAHLATKARLPSDAWRSPEAMVLTYQVEAFKEK